MDFIYRSAFIIGITLLVPIILKYLIAKGNEDETAVYVVKMRSNMMKILKIITVIFVPLGVIAAIAFLSYLQSKDWKNMCYTAVVVFSSIADFFLWEYYKNNKIIVLDNNNIKVIKGRKIHIFLKSKITYKKVNDCKLKLYYNDKKIFTVTRQFDNFENMESWLNNLEQGSR